jgi:hypothetical protein
MAIVGFCAGPLRGINGRWNLTPPLKTHMIAAALLAPRKPGALPAARRTLEVMQWKLV